MNPSLLASSYFLHLVATIVWIGGMALLILIIYPLQKRHDSEQWQTLLDAIETRFRPFSNFSLLILLMTGVVQTSSDEHYSGLLSFDTDWSLAILGKHIVFLGMMGIVVVLQFGLAPALERAKLLAKKQDAQRQSLAALRQRERRLMQVNFGLGLMVLVFTAIATAL